ncbi:MAG TPA: acyl-CoA dehydrogenase family protein [Gemmatimonadaceae bacterium]|nr:acyl-CoA dehydrogenase family protein [Gemmatimonadaceae bacterium]
MSELYQDGPRLANQYASDDLLRSHLRRRLPPGMRDDIEPELERFGARVATDILALGDAAESAPPRHVPYDPWGRRVDDIVVSDAWRALDRISAEDGLIAIAYERRHGAWSRVHQMAKLYLFHPSSATYSCPLAMADGAARFIEVHGGDDPHARAALEHLTTRDPARFWTSGQWMTERSGGSDVALTTTVARRDEALGAHRLFGTKWFTSATTSQMAMALARMEGAPAGGRGLSVFLIELRDASGALQGIRVNRLKDKLGTRALPTAELTLEGTPATLVGGEGDGIRKIATLFTVTRVYNAVAAVAGMRRALALARDYATRRVAFGRPLAEHPLHADTLAELDARVRASFLLTFRVVELMGKEECGEASERELAVFRLLTPVAKLFTGKEAVAVASEAIECLGGAGYVEDTGLPRLLRDAQVLPIWEGTTNVLSLDVLRAIERSGALDPWLADVRARLDTLRSSPLDRLADRVRAAVADIERQVTGTRAAEREAGARRLAFAIARTTAAALLLEHADWARREGDADAPAALAAAERWVLRALGAEMGAAGAM